MLKCLRENTQNPTNWIMHLLSSVYVEVTCCRYVQQSFVGGGYQLLHMPDSTSCLFSYTRLILKIFKSLSFNFNLISAAKTYQEIGKLV